RGADPRHGGRGGGERRARQRRGARDDRHRAEPRGSRGPGRREMGDPGRGRERGALPGERRQQRDLGRDDPGARGGGGVDSRPPIGRRATPAYNTVESPLERSAMGKDLEPIGRVVGTERKPNTPHEFHFWTAPDSPVGIGALVKLCVDRPRPVTVYGIVVDGAAWTDVESVLHDYIGMEGQPAPEFPIPTERPEIRVYTAAVLRHEPEEPL